jgi:tRNA A-37 threonylcarbamoyl transferase component Bud32
VNDTFRADADPLVGTTLAERYLIVEQLGSGGMGAVYRAEHVHMKKSVAVKILHRHMTTNQEVVARFEREAVAAGRIEHPNVAAATDFGRLPDGSFYLVLEYVEGKSLGVLMDEGPMAPARALAITRQIADGLAAAHAAGVVHRDLKPDNVLLFERDGVRDIVKVLDFGIAKVHLEEGSGHRPLTQIGTIFGTPQYMSPEQGQGRTVDARSDLYALGVLLYEMLAGELPFDADDLVVLITRHVTEPPPALPAAIPAPVRSLVSDLLAKKPEERVASAAILRERIDALLAEMAPEVTFAWRAGSRVSAGRGPSTASAVSATNATVAAGPSTRGGFENMTPRARGPAERVVRALELAQRELVRRVPALERPVRVGGVVLPLFALVGGGAVLALFGALLAVLIVPARSGRHPPGTSASAEGAALAPKNSEEAKHGELVRRAEAGNRQALAVLEALPPKQRKLDDARALGRGYANAGEWTSAVAAYRTGVLSFTALRSDPDVLSDVRRACEQESSSEEALRLAAHQLGEKGLDLLWDVWTATKNKPDRAAVNRRVRQFLDDSAVREHATRELGLVFELERAEKRHRCGDAKALLPKVSEYGDARLLPILDRFKLTRGCGFVDLGDCWECLRGGKELARAREAAEKRPAPTFGAR